MFLTSENLVGICWILNAFGTFKAEFNAVFVVNVVMCCGLAVEFCAHTTIAFLRSKGTREERARIVKRCFFKNLIGAGKYWQFYFYWNWVY